jgi:hypothetical protein
MDLQDWTMFPLPTALTELMQQLEQAGIGFYLTGSLRAIISFAAVFSIFFLCLEGARRLHLISENVLDMLGPLAPFSLLLASVTWSLFSAIECVLVETPLPAWVVVKFIAVMLMVAFVISPITILLGIPVCAIHFLFKRIPASVIYTYVTIVMSLECIWYAQIDQLGVR